MSTKVRWGIIGTASIAEKFVQGLHSSAHGVAAGIAARKPEDAHKFASEYGVEKVYQSYDELLDDSSITCVYIPVPSTKKCEWALKAISKGKHVLVDKPFWSESDLMEMVSSAHKHKLHFMDGTMWVHNPRADKIKYEMTGLGGVRTVSCRLCSEMDDHKNIRYNPDLEPLGALGDLAWYCVRGSLWAMDYELPASVMAVGQFSENVITGVNGMLLWKDGRTAVFNSAFELHYTQFMEIIGKEKLIRIDDPFFPWSKEHIMFPNLEDAKAPLEFCTITPPAQTEGKQRCTTHESEAVYQEVLMIDHFSEMCTKEYKQSHWPVESIKTMRVLDALMQSMNKDSAIVEVNQDLSAMEKMK